MPPRSAIDSSAMTGLGHDEETAEWQQRAAVGAARIRARDQLGIGGLEAAAFRLLEGIEQWPEPRALGPLLDRVLAFEHLEILALPDVESGGARSQHTVVKGGIANRDRAEKRLELGAPRPAPGRASPSGGGRAPETSRDFARQHPPRRQPG